MRKIAKEIECLTRLQQMTEGLDAIMLFLKEEKLITDGQIKESKTSPNYPKAMHAVITTLHAAEKFQLLEYEWSLLPVERIKITIVTDRAQREFTYDSV